MRELLRPLHGRDAPSSRDSSRGPCTITIHAGEQPRRILVVDDDESTRQMIELGLRLHGFTVVTAGSGADAIRIAARAPFDVVIVDLKLGDMSGIDVIRSLRDGGQHFILISGFLSVGTAVEAMKLGAVDVMEKPLDLERLVTTAAAPLRAATAAGTIRAPTAARAQAGAGRSAGRSAAERWVGYVLQACEAETDLKTLASWAQQAGVSYTTLCTNCRIMRIRPLDARDFTRVLRALKRASADRCPPEVFLDVSDERTVRTLSRRAGVDLALRASRSSVPEFLDRQLFVATDNQGLHLIRDAVQGWHPGPRGFFDASPPRAALLCDDPAAERQNAR